MIWPVIPAIAISCTTGWLLVAWLRSDGRYDRGGRLLQFCLATGVGLCLSSSAFFLARLVDRTGRFHVLWIDLIGLGVVLLVRRWAPPPRAACAVETEKPRAELPIVGRLLHGVLALAVASGLVAMLTFVHHRALGFWDAWAIWNLKARFLLSDGAEWQRIFAEPIAWSHTDYPLLLPLNVARLWTYQGGRSAQVPAVLSILLALLVVATLYAGVARLRGRVQGCLAALALLATAGFVGQGAYQTADIPVGWFLLASLCTLSLAPPGERGAAGHRLLAGLLVGAAAWTKNEGALMALSLLGGTLLVTMRRAGLKRALRDAGWLLAGLALPLVCLVGLKTGFPVQSDLAVGLDLESVVRKAADWTRHRAILSAAVDLLRQQVGLGLLVALVVISLVAGVARERIVRTWAGTHALILLMIGAGYYGVYLLTPRDLAWHLETSTDRLLVQVWPSLLFVLFLGIGRLSRVR